MQKRNALWGNLASLTVVEQHTAIVTAIQEGQPDAAALAMQAHREWALASYQQEV